jgi:hypothetical protein
MVSPRKSAGEQSIHVAASPLRSRKHFEHLAMARADALWLGIRFHFGRPYPRGDSGLNRSDHNGSVEATKLGLPETKLNSSIVIDRPDGQLRNRAVPPAREALRRYGQHFAIGRAQLGLSRAHPEMKEPLWITGRWKILRPLIAYSRRHGGGQRPGPRGRSR